MTKIDLNTLVCHNPLCNQMGFKPEYLALEPDVIPGEEQNLRAYKCDHCQTRFYYSVIEEEDCCHHIELAGKYAILFFVDSKRIQIHELESCVESTELTAENCKFMMKKYQLLAFQ